MNLNKLMAGAGGRRFVLTVGCALVCTALLCAGRITPEIFRDLILGTVAVYIAGNTWQKIKQPTTEEPEP